MKWRRYLKQIVAAFLTVSMVIPGMAPIIALAAETAGNTPRYVSFVRPEALKLGELGLATPADSDSEESLGENGQGGVRNNVVTEKDDVGEEFGTEAREPEFFYTDFPEEPDGILVDFSETSRTYLIEENVAEGPDGEPINSYITIVGGSPYLYKDADGRVKQYDNTLEPAAIRQRGKTSAATASNAAEDGKSAVAMYRTADKNDDTPTDYQNADGRVKIRIPDRMDSGNGYVISDGENTLEIIPTEGDYSNSAVADNAIRYSDVFDNVDVQYTVLGDSVKEDIILLDRQERNEFSYKLRSSGMKYRKNGDSIEIRKSGGTAPIFRITAPAMIDADGCVSTDIELKFDSSAGRVTFAADKDWLNDPERTYPVRIDPGTELVGHDAFTFNMVTKGDDREHAGTGTLDEQKYNSHYADFGPALAGYSEIYGHCRIMISIDTAWEKLVNHSATQTGGPGVKKVQFSVSTMTQDAMQRTPFVLRVMEEAWDPNTVSYASICNLKSTQTGNAQYTNGKDTWISFDITDTYYKWVNGTKPRYGLMLEVEGESDYDPADVSSVWWGETFYNKSSATNGPRLEVAWEGSLEGADLNLLPMSKFSLEVGPGMVETAAGGRTVRGILAHGASQAGSSVEYRIREENGDGIIAEGSTEAYEDVECPDYLQVSGDCIQEEYQDSNWQSDPVMCGGELELDTIYYAEAKSIGLEVVEDPATGEPVLGENEEESEELVSDKFLLYEVQATDILPRIARHYGVSVETLRKDNKFEDRLTVAGDVIFIRNPKTSEPYTPALSSDKMEEVLKECQSLGVDYRDYFSMEPVNMASGSFYMNQTDASVEDLGGPFSIERSYNSVAPYFRSDFGMGWSSLTNEKIMILEDSRIIYVREDGKGILFERTDGGYRASQGYDYVLKEIKPAESQTENAPGSDETAAWKITQPDGSGKLFNSGGLLVAETDLKGHVTSYEYDSDLLLNKIVSPSGKEYGITQTPEGLITDIALPDGGSLHYGYDEEDNLISVTDPEGGVKRFEYDAEHHMTAWYDEDGNRVVANSYDDSGRVMEQTDGLGNVSRMDYGDGLTVMTDARGFSTSYRLNSQRMVTRVEYANGDAVTRTYSDDLRLVSETDEEGSTTAYTYDDAGNILTETRDDGSTAIYTYNELNLPVSTTDYEGNTTEFSYDEIGNLLSMTDGAGNTIRYTYDDLSRVTAMTDANGRTSVFAYEGKDAPVVAYTDSEGGVSSYTYDGMNRVLTETDPEGHTTRHTYNANGWETSVTAPDGGVTAYRFSPAGEVLSITDAMGQETVFTYDAMHNILTGTDALGNTLSYRYDENYNRVAETDALGHTTSYAYDARGRLTGVTDALGHTVSYELDGRGNVLKTTDRRGNSRTARYDKVLGLPVMTADEKGNETEYSYDRNGNLRKVTYPDGTSVSYTYDGADRMTETTAQNGLKTQIVYDGNGNMTEIADDETRVYRFVYDGNNRLMKAVDPLGGETEYAYDGSGNRIRSTDANGESQGYAYDPEGRLTEVRDALGGTVTAEYDQNGRTLSVTDQNGHTLTWVYDAIGRTLAQVDASGSVTGMEYDPLGNMTKVTDALKGVTKTEYDALSRTVKMTDALNGVYSCEYDANGNLVSAVMPDGDDISMSYDEANLMTGYRDEAGVETLYEYDAMGRITKASDTAGNVMTYEYDESGNLVKQTDTIGRAAVYEYDRFGRLISVTGTDGATTDYAYDALDRLTSVTLADGTATAYEYDPAGNLIRMTEPGDAVSTYAYDASGRLTCRVNPLGASTTFLYDAKGNLTGTVDAEGISNSYAYDAADRLVSYTDGRGNSTVYEYDELSRLLSRITPEGNKDEYRYDALGRLTKAKDPNGLITEYRYDAMGNLTEIISPKGAKTSYTYDKHDELTGVTDPAGNVTSYTVDMNRNVTEMVQKNGGSYRYTYDAVHRLTSVSTPLGLTREFTYDAADNILKDTDNLGRTNTYEYDIMHRMTKSVNAEGGVTTYGYDIRGNQNQVTDALGRTWTYRYDLADQLTASVDPEGKATEAVYNLVGQIASVTEPGGRTTSFTYDGNYNVTALSDPKGYIYSYTYDKDDRLTGTKNPLGETETAVYDAGSRITSVTDRMGLTESYVYDPHGNVLSAKTADGRMTKFSYDVLDNLVKVTLPSGLTADYAYDVMGNLTGSTDTMKRTTTYAYDLEGNLTGITDPAGRREQMSYDIGGRLTGYTSNGGNRIRYDYDKLNDLTEKAYEDERDPEGKEGVIYAYDVTGQRVSMMDRSGESKYEYDSLGRIRKVTTGSGEATEYAYDGCDRLESVTYADGKKVHYQYDKNDNLTEVTDRTGAKTVYVYDALNRLTEIHRPNGVSTYNTYNAHDQIVELKNLCDDCGWVVSEYSYTYDDRGFIVGEDATESLYGYAWDDKHDGKHENGRHDDLYPHGGQHTNKHEKDGEYNFQIVETKRSFEYDDDGKLVKVTEEEENQGTYVYEFEYDDMGNRTLYKKSRNGTVQESAEYTYNLSNQVTAARLYDGKHYKNVEYTYDEDGNRILQEEVKDDGTRKAETTYEYTVEDRLKAVSDGKNLLAAMAYDGDGNRIFQLNYNLHTDDDWKGSSGNGNGNNKDNQGKGNGKSSGKGNGNTGNTDDSANQSGILFPIEGEVSELEAELIGMIGSTGKQKNYELTEYVNDVNREHAEVLMELNINGIMDTAYSYGTERLTNERFTGWTGYYTYDGRGSVSGVTDSEGMIWQSYRYDAFGGITFGKPQYNNVYAYNGESYNPNSDTLYLRARYYVSFTASFLTEDSYLGSIADPLTLNRYLYAKGSPPNYTDPSGHKGIIDQLNAMDQEDLEAFLYAYGLYSRRLEADNGYVYDPDPTHTPKWADSDYYENIQGMMSATNSAAYLFGLTGSAASMYIEKTGKTLGETMSEAAEGTIRDLCGIKGAIKYAANTAAVYELARVLGFIYDESEDLYYTRKDSLQYLFGFNDGIDLNEYMLGMNLNALSIEFQGEGGRYWRLELWNGQYGLGLATGAEIGLYERKTGESIDSEELKHYRSAEREDWLDMSFTLIDKKTGATIMERSSHDYERYYEEEYGEYAGKDWWITGYKLGEYIPKEDIRMEADIYFTKSQWENMGMKIADAIPQNEGDIIYVNYNESEWKLSIIWD